MIPYVVINDIEPIVRHNSLWGFKRHEYRFPNGYGASVNCNAFSCGLELAVTKFDGKGWYLCHTTPIADDVVGYIDGEEELRRLLTSIYNLQGDSN